jgi:glucose-6-phosphate 1-dehydrogenase
MELTISFDAVGVRAKKTELLQAHRAISPENVPQGRHGGIVLGQEVPAYRHEPKVTVDPGTEKYVTLKLDINQGWPHTAIRP